MSIELFKRLGALVILLLLQMLVLKHICLFGCALPLLYVHFALTFRRGYPQWAILLWCFAMGLAVDTFTNTQGVTAASMTLIGLLQPYVFKLFIPRDSAEDLPANVRSIGLAKYALYSFLLVFVFCLTLFTLDSFQFFNWQQWALNVGGSTLLTWIIIMALENVRS